MWNIVKRDPVMFGVLSFFVIIRALIEVSLAFVLMYIIDLAQAGNVSMFFNGIVFFLVYFLVSTVIDFLVRYLHVVFRRRGLISLRKEGIENVLNKDLRSFREAKTGEYLSILTNDLGQIGMSGYTNVTTIIHLLVAFIAAFISIVYISLPIAFMILGLTFLGFMTQGIFGKGLAERKEAHAKGNSVLTGALKEAFEGFEVVTSFRIQDKMRERLLSKSKNAEDLKASHNLYQNIVTVISQVIGTLIFICPMLYGGYLVLQGNITVGTLIALIQLMNNITSPVMSGIQIVNQFASIKALFARLNGLSKTTKKIDVLHTGSFKDEIVFDNVSYSYDDNHIALRDFTYRFKKGKKYALVGESGSGKSTILKMMTAYDEPKVGSVMMDNVKISHWDDDALFSQMSPIPQHVFIFDGSLSDNVTLFHESPANQVKYALGQSGLESMLHAKRMQADDEVGECGMSLSGGEKQRVSIARALMKQSPVILVDEATSALDNETAFKVEQTLLSLKNQTLVTVTHKLMEQNLMKYDDILVMKDGMLVESGSFEELMQKNGYFTLLNTIGKKLDAAV